MRTAAIVALLAAASGCAVGRQLVAGSGDFADYRAFRTAAHEGRRLALAQRYLEEHPHGEWAGEVQSAFVAEEAKYFEAAQTSRKNASEYLLDLPRGPHAKAAEELLTLFDAHYEKKAIEDLIREARRTEAMLDYAKDERRKVMLLVTAEVRALLDPAAFGVPLAEAPDSLRFALSGRARPTTGWAPRRRADNVFFSLLSPAGKESRVAEVVFEVLLDDQGRTVEGRVEGPDLFVRWLEADENQAFDPTEREARAHAASHVAERLFGLFEAVLPAERCGNQDTPDEIFTRRCDGWVATAWMGRRAGERDVIAVRGPQGQAGSATSVRPMP